jgi:hypothetical protein
MSTMRVVGVECVLTLSSLCVFYGSFHLLAAVTPDLSFVESKSAVLSCLFGVTTVVTGAYAFAHARREKQRLKSEEEVNRRDAIHRAAFGEAKVQ